MSIWIEIQEQPERQRFRAEVEVGGLVARRKEVMSGLTGDVLADFDAHVLVIRAALVGMLPKPKAAKSVEEFAADAPRVYWEAQSEPTQWPSPTASIPTAVTRELLSPSEMNDAARQLMGETKAKHDADATLDVLRTEAEAAGVRVDGRWSERRLRQEIAAAAQRGEVGNG